MFLDGAAEFLRDVAVEARARADIERGEGIDSPVFQCDARKVRQLAVQTRHDAPDDDGVGVHGPCQHLGGDWLAVLGHVQEDVKNAGRSAVPFM
ncbi:hypothetical protein BG36_13630 [Aquamicrobium defluvii]|uniref:Uncharacterized protein n=1 Tax=Aquamicrobium defluvii TaxID=69279 RepID=A0A011SUL4_9HYPH|nr:hypothetical protein BG36_13630 [Aquamicrobium defluvii]EZQ13374.1 hypothetical protein CF98_28465 [Halopseudomonas bauzanensis]TDR33250.1 hypothetical protein DES43_12446 [Aquamicrobium defluvii]